MNFCLLRCSSLRSQFWMRLLLYFQTPCSSRVAKLLKEAKEKWAEPILKVGPLHLVTLLAATAKKTSDLLKAAASGKTHEMYVFKPIVHSLQFCWSDRCDKLRRKKVFTQKKHFSLYSQTIEKRGVFFNGRFCTFICTLLLLMILHSGKIKIKVGYFFVIFKHCGTSKCPS